MNTFYVSGVIINFIILIIGFSNPNKRISFEKKAKQAESFISENGLKVVVLLMAFLSWYLIVYIILEKIFKKNNN